MGGALAGVRVDADVDDAGLEPTAGTALGLEGVGGVRAAAAAAADAPTLG